MVICYIMQECRTIVKAEGGTSAGIRILLMVFGSCVNLVVQTRSVYSDVT
jgi:hypothetical protein